MQHKNDPKKINKRRRSEADKDNCSSKKIDNKEKELLLPEGMNEELPLADRKSVV